MAEENEKIEKAKRIITEGVEQAGFKVVKILLFGSRARGDFKDVSDFDFYVVINSELNFPDRWKLISDIQEKLFAQDITGDVLICSEDHARKYKNDVGRVTYYALKEGLEI